MRNVLFRLGGGTGNVQPWRAGGNEGTNLAVVVHAWNWVNVSAGRDKMPGFSAWSNQCSPFLHFFPTKLEKHFYCISVGAKPPCLATRAARLRPQFPTSGAGVSRRSKISSFFKVPASETSSGPDPAARQRQWPLPAGLPHSTAGRCFPADASAGLFPAATSTGRPA